jgi:hypothetical protein
MAAQRRRWPWIVALLLSVMSTIFAWNHSEGKRAEAARLQEAAEAKLESFVVADRMNRKAIEKLSGESETLKEEIERLRDSVPSVEVREVVRWRTETVEVPVDRLVERIIEVPAPAPGCPDCPPLPEVRLYVTGTEARLRSDAQNLFAVGEVEVWREADPDVMLLTAPWQADLTQLVEREPQKRYARLGYWAGLSRKMDIERFYQTGGLDHEDRYTYKAGASFTVGSLTLMAGVNTDEAVEVLGLWRPRR